MVDEIRIDNNVYRMEMIEKQGGIMKIKDFRVKFALAKNCDELLKDLVFFSM